MISKIVLATAVLAVAVAQHNIGYGHGHGHAVSSQNVVLHQTHGHVQHAPIVAQHSIGYGHGHGHAVSSQNVVLHQTHGHVQHAPIVAHAPVVAHTPVIAHHTPVITHAPIVHHQPTHYSSQGHNVDYHAPAHYSFEYSVNDPHTHDIKSQQETREGDAVHGSYSLHEADGTVRRVEYTADAHSGFNAIVHREGHAAHAVPVHQPAHYSHH